MSRFGFFPFSLSLFLSLSLSLCFLCDRIDYRRNVLNYLHSTTPIYKYYREMIIHDLRNHCSYCIVSYLYICYRILHEQVQNEQVQNIYVFFCCPMILPSIFPFFRQSSPCSPLYNDYIASIRWLRSRKTFPSILPKHYTFFFIRTSKFDLRLKVLNQKLFWGSKRS